MKLFMSIGHAKRFIFTFLGLSEDINRKYFKHFNFNDESDNFIVSCESLIRRGQLLSTIRLSVPLPLFAAGCRQPAPPWQLWRLVSWPDNGPTPGAPQLIVHNRVCSVQGRTQGHCGVCPVQGQLGSPAQGRI